MLKITSLIHEVNGEQVTEIHPVFPIPILYKPFSKHKKWNKNFENFDHVDRRPGTWTTPVNTSFPEIKPDDPYVSVEDRDGMSSDLLMDVKSMMRDFHVTDDIYFSEFWYNAYYQGQGQEPHDHLSEVNYNAFWSGVYFCKGCFPGSFTLTRRDQSVRLQQYVDWSKSDPQLGQYYQNIMQPPIKDGDLILFPPHVLHAVTVDERNKDNMRLSFSFNVYREPLNVQHVDGRTLPV